jgi:peptidoglycan/LPS O-acetylase OafA/YrhL
VGIFMGMTMGGGMFYSNLEALRGLCAVLVALFHVTWTSHLTNLAVVANGWVFVDLFFVLSGFIMFQTYSTSLVNMTQVKAFMIKRFFRLYPLHITTMASIFVLEVSREFIIPAVTSIPANGYFQDGFGLSAILNILLLQGMGISDNAFFNVPSWSISVEFWTYAFFAAVCLCNIGSFLRVIFMFLTGVLCFTTLLIWNAPHGIYTATEFGFLRGVASFGLGGLAWYAAKNTPKIDTAILYILYFTTGVALLVSLQFFDDNTSWNALAPSLFAVVIFLFAKDQDEVRSIVQLALTNRLFVTVGTYSYSIYMVHTSVLAVCNFAMRRVSDASSVTPGTKFEVPLWIGDAGILAYLFVVILISAVTYRWIERPWRNYGKDLALGYTEGERMKWALSMRPLKPNSQVNMR